MPTEKNQPPFGGFWIWERAPKNSWQIRWDFWQAVAIVLGVIILGIYAWSRGGLWSPDFRSFAICVLIAAAALAVGLLFGFLFGIPKAAQEPQSSQSGGQIQTGKTANTSNTTVAAQPNAKSKANTNLVEISDWLTKMIVGVGLYQLSTLPPKLKALAGYFATAFTPPGPGPALVLAILGYFAVFGFLLGYLWARIYLPKEFGDADGDGSSESPGDPGKKQPDSANPTQKDAVQAEATASEAAPGEKVNR